MHANSPLQIVSAPSILGLWPSGVEHLADTLLSKKLQQRLHTKLPVLAIPTLNDQYSEERDPATGCVNLIPIQKFSEQLAGYLEIILSEKKFPLVLGGDCSILLGIMPAAKKLVQSGLVFIDAHADFYLPQQSTTGQVADMDLAMVTGRGPKELTNIRNASPYVSDGLVLHLAQRDQAETKHYGSQDIHESGITCIDLDFIQSKGLFKTTEVIQSFFSDRSTNRFWIHFDTDSLDDAINPAVDYRLPGGLSLSEANDILKALFQFGNIIGMSVAIFNPTKDPSGNIAEQLVQLLSDVLNNRKPLSK